MSRAQHAHAAPRPRWSVGDVLWLLVPVLSLGGVAAYFAASVALGVTPPFAVVDGQSMRPTMTPGDMVILRGLPGHEVRVGDVVSISLPEEVQEEKSLPAEVVHRVVEKRGTGSEVTFVTQGDNNPGKDAFVTTPGMIRGEVIHTVPGLGYPILFFRSLQGQIFLAALGLAVVGYFVIAALERRQEAAEQENPTEAILQLEEALEEDRETLKVLVEAVQEYGEHLRSHTQAVKDMAAAAEALAHVAQRLRPPDPPAPST